MVKKYENNTEGLLSSKLMFSPSTVKLIEAIAKLPDRDNIVPYRDEDDGLELDTDIPIAVGADNISIMETITATNSSPRIHIFSSDICDVSDWFISQRYKRITE